jgi:cell division initiation protein
MGAWIVNFVPNDLQNIAFKKSMMGYNILQVEDVLLKVVEDLSELIKENAKLKEKLEDSQDKVKYYKTIENNLHNSLIIAQQTSEEIVANARDNADNIVKEAELKAQQIIDEAHKQVLNVKFEYENLRARCHCIQS